MLAERGEGEQGGMVALETTRRADLLHPFCCFASHSSASDSKICAEETSAAARSSWRSLTGSRPSRISAFAASCALRASVNEQAASAPMV